MQTLRLSISLPDHSHPDMQLRLSEGDAGCDVLIALPAPALVAAAVKARIRYDAEPPCGKDDYVLGGYAGI